MLSSTPHTSGFFRKVKKLISLRMSHKQDSSAENTSVPLTEDALGTSARNGAEDTSVPLCEETLGALDPSLYLPGFDRKELTAGIVHFGVGNFHRAHQAWCLNGLFAKGKDHDWAIIGAGVLPEEIPQYEALQKQDCLFSVIAQTAENVNPRVIGSIIDYIKPTDTERTIQVLSQKEIRIVSLTITEGGYFITASMEFDTGHRQIKADADHPENPKTVFGIIIAALRIRRESGILPFTIMSCDNVPHNGEVTRNAVCGLANLMDPAFGKWIFANVCFPNSMVDRITTVTRERERSIIREEYKLADAVPVFCEDFCEWVIEDTFSAGRPSLQDVGVHFVEDVTPFETLKLRALNGGHACIAYAAALTDIDFVHEAMHDTFIKGFLKSLLREEILPAIPPLPGACKHVYAECIVERFSNPKIGDTVRRLCFDGSNRQPKFIVPTIQAGIRRETKTIGLALASALWCRYCYGTSDSGKKFEPNDPNWKRLTRAAKAAKQNPIRWLQQRDIYGSLSEEEAFVDQFTRWLDLLHKSSAMFVLVMYLSTVSELLRPSGSENASENTGDSTDSTASSTDSGAN